MYYFHCLLYTQLRVNVVGYDYTGYGASAKFDDLPTDQHTYTDIECVYDWVCTYQQGMLVGGPQGDPGKRILLYGQSVGSGPSCYLASNHSLRKVLPTQSHASSRNNTLSCVSETEHKKQNTTDGSSSGYPNAGSSGSNVANETKLSQPYVPILEAGSCSNLSCCSTFVRRVVAGLILHSPICSGLRVLTPNRCLACCDIYPNIDLVTCVTSPVWIIHGNRDQEVPFSHGQQLQEAVPPQHRTQPWWVPGKGHNDVLQNNEDELITRMNKFIAVIKRRQREAAASAAALAAKVRATSKPANITATTSSTLNSTQPSSDSAMCKSSGDTPQEANTSMSTDKISVTFIPPEKNYADLAVKAASYDK